jgi:hypothetical protein
MRATSPTRGRGGRPYIRRYCAADDVCSRCFASGSLAADWSSDYCRHLHRGDRSSGDPTGRSCRTTPVDVRRTRVDQCRCGDDLAVRGHDRLNDRCGRCCEDACASEILRSSGCNATARAGARGSNANVFSRRSRKMKKGREAALEGKREPRFNEDRSSAGGCAGRTADASAGATDAACISEVSQTENGASKGVRHFGSVKALSDWLCSIISRLTRCGAAPTRGLTRAQRPAFVSSAPGATGAAVSAFHRSPELTHSN